MWLRRNRSQVEHNVQNPECMTLLDRIKDDLEIGGLMYIMGRFHPLEVQLQSSQT